MLKFGKNPTAELLSTGKGIKGLISREGCIIKAGVRTRVGSVVVPFLSKCLYVASNLKMEKNKKIPYFIFLTNSGKLLLHPQKHNTSYENIKDRLLELILLATQFSSFSSAILPTQSRKLRLTAESCCYLPIIHELT